MKFWTSCAVGAFIPISSVTTPASAQTAASPVEAADPMGQASPTASEPSAEGVGDIIVTAQKRSESLQTTPLAITVLTGDDLQKCGVSNLIDLQSAVPNVNIQQRTSYGVVTIRRVGFNILTAGFDSSVAVHQDGVYISRSAAALASLFDVERIEIARSPQGALFGRNATGSAVNIISRKPTENLSGYLSASYGNNNVVSVEGTIVPGLLSVRVAGSDETRDGYVTRPIQRAEVHSTD